MLTPPSAAIDPGLPAEQMRKRTLAGLMTMSTGGLLPSHITLSTVHDVLKIACGTGEWCLDLALSQPSLTITGIDTHAESIASARTQADVLNLAQVSFHCLPSFLPLPFPDASFDLVHARFLSWHLLKEEWEPLLKECHRVGRNGATLQVTDYEMGLSVKDQLS